MSVTGPNAWDSFFHIQKQFFATVTFKNIDWKDLLKECCSDDGESIQLNLLQRTVLHPINKLQPIRLSYQTSFLKQVIGHIESKSAPIASELYETYCCLIHSNTEDEAFIHFFAENVDHPLVTVLESVSVISNGTTGLSTWPAARALAELASQNSSLFSGKSVLELGCGTGLLGLSIIRTAKPSAFFLTDCHPDVLRLVEKNIAINFCGKSEKLVPDCENVLLQASLNGTDVRVVNLPWEDVSCDIVKQLLPDIIVAADVVYDKSIIDALVSAFKTFCVFGKTVDIFVACAVRNEDTLQCFVDSIVRGDGWIQELRTPPVDIFFYICDVPLKIFKIGFNNGKK